MITLCGYEGRCNPIVWIIIGKETPNQIAFVGFSGFQAIDKTPAAQANARKIRRDCIEKEKNLILSTGSFAISFSRIISGRAAPKNPQ
jgi:hypothetical protein